MSRIGIQPVVIPNGVTVALADGVITVKGPKGDLSQAVPPNMTVTIDESKIVVTRPNDEKQNKSYHGLARSLIFNMVHGVSEGFAKELEINGVGYRAQLQGKKLVLALGYSHPIEFETPEGIEITIEGDKKNRLKIVGIDKQLVGQTAAVIRGYRKPEPYKGKGIKYVDEYILRKTGKTAGAKE
jgi:large subunit ribosomal protein L6